MRVTKTDDIQKQSAPAAKGKQAVSILACHSLRRKYGRSGAGPPALRVAKLTGGSRNWVTKCATSVTRCRGDKSISRTARKLKYLREINAACLDLGAES